MMYGVLLPASRQSAEVNRPSVQCDLAGVDTSGTKASKASPRHSPQEHCHVRHTSHVPTWLDSNLLADWTSARGTLCSCFPETTAFSTADLRIHRARLVSTFLSPRILLTSAFTMDVPEPDQSPFTAVTAHTSKLTRVSFDCRLRGCDQRNAFSHSPIAGIWLSEETWC
jgi:hypothetical protein